MEQQRTNFAMLFGQFMKVHLASLNIIVEQFTLDHPRMEMQRNQQLPAYENHKQEQ
jgi:hypothetical protein